MSAGIAAGFAGAAAPPNEDQIELAEKGAAEGGREEGMVSSSGSSATVDDSQGPRVDVQDAEKQFEELRRQLSRSSSLHRTITGQKDVEAGAEEDFDLAEYLQGGLAERDAAGFKRKVVGVTWNNLTVTGAGGMKIFMYV